jgi:Flp pilus assembly protein TadG
MVRQRAMLRLLEFLRRNARRFRLDRSGNVAVMFGLTITPMIVGVGAAVDYTRVASVRNKLNNAADVATLASVSKDAKPFTNTPTQASVQKIFNTAASVVPSATITSFSATVTPGATQLVVSANYTASVPLVFGSFLGRPSVTVAGTSTAAVNSPNYVNFYLLLDNSPSMGLGATANDINNLITLTANQTATVSPNVKSGSIARSSCAFACHQHTFNSSGQITGDDTSDNYHIAKANGVTLRIDVMRTATQQLTQSAAATEIYSNQIGMAVYTFSDTFQTIAPLSTNMPTVSTDAAAIDLAYAYWDARDAQTSFDTSLSYINGIMPNPGTGSSLGSPLEFLMIVTDGVEDAPVSGSSGSGDPADSPSSYLPPNNQPNLANSLSGNVNSGRLIDMIKTGQTSMCQTIKNRGIQIAVLYTPYMPVTNNGFYNQWIGATATSLNNNNPVNPNDATDPAQNGIGQALKACASPGFYYQVTPTGGISQAMNALFSKAIETVKLTQ